MGISKFNGEGYYDPTPYQAVCNLERQPWRPLVYICSPYAGDEKVNAEKAARYCRFAVSSGVIPLAPHLFFPHFMSEETERELIMFMNMVLLGRCAELWVFGGRITKGMQAEIAKAKQRNMNIRYFTEECGEDS